MASRWSTRKPKTFLFPKVCPSAVDEDDDDGVYVTTLRGTAAEEVEVCTGWDISSESSC